MGSFDESLEQMTPEMLAETAGAVMARLGKALSEAARLLGERVEETGEVEPEAPAESGGSEWLAKTYCEIGRMVVAGETGGELDALVARTREGKSRADAKAAAGPDSMPHAHTAVGARDVREMIERRAEDTTEK